MSSFSRWLILACSFMFAVHAHAAAPLSLHEKADTLKLADTPYWHLLLRYQPLHAGWRSEARSTHFFLSPQGRDNPALELHALLDELFVPQLRPDEGAACRFPARRAWLQEQLQFTAPAADCPLLMEWKAAIRPAQATVVFASDYLNNPSSMFGHTFLRLDAPEQNEDTRLLAYAVNYAANAHASNPLSFAWNGLTGGYRGLFSLMPYYDKVKEYSDLENRDLWEYQLTFTPEELQRLLDHLWELRSVEFPYYFLTRNCSFQLLSLFEVARPGLQMRNAFPMQAIPTDTVRRVVTEAGLLRKLVYRPAAERRLLQDAHDNPAAVNKAAHELARNPDAATDLPAPEQAAALETGYDYHYYYFLAGDQTPEARQNLRTLLLRRAAIPVPDLRSPPPQPAIDPANGHATARLALAAGHARQAGYVALRFRPAYHDLLDPPAGYRPGAHIDFLNTELRIDDAHQKLGLERLAVVDIDSMAPWDAFFKPWSWFFGFGQRQAAVDSQGRFDASNSHGVAFADGGAGSDLKLGDALECYLLLAASTEAGRALEQGWRVGTGPRGGCLYNLPRARLRLQSDSRYYNDIEGLEIRTTLETQFDLASDHGLRLQVGQLQHGSRHSGSAEIAWIHYF